ncbi:hypothetical protein CesoFtcFv8_023576 [Champsocephalus esox]|uniref:Uncharacterized protein n=1 Tax=Champsocephalus esox TaxID=159716 RepID=A0AAN8B984_9TELE|nr:hypothetical protein CesoFtcFv8_023576 [Champsocephalus esox]
MALSYRNHVYSRWRVNTPHVDDEQQVRERQGPVEERTFSHSAALLKHADKPACVFAFGFLRAPLLGDRCYLPSRPPLRQTRATTAQIKMSTRRGGGGGAVESRLNFTR